MKSAHSGEQESLSVVLRIRVEQFDDGAVFEHGADGVYFVKSRWTLGGGAVLLDSPLIPSPSIVPQGRAYVDGP